MGKEPSQYTTKLKKPFKRSYPSKSAYKQTKLKLGGCFSSGSNPSKVVKIVVNPENVARIVEKTKNNLRKLLARARDRLFVKSLGTLRL